MLTPGEPEERTRRQRLAEGVPLPDDTWASIVNAARQVGVDERRIQQVGRELDAEFPLPRLLHGERVAR